MFLCGDLFTKGPDPLGVWALIRQHDLACVKGNHDDHVATKPTKFGHWLTPEIQSFLSRLPLTRRVGRCILVHAGIHPTKGLAGTTRRIALYQRRFPDDKDPANPFWYDAGWQGPECVVFGHDAMRGLVRREKGGIPIAIGLDTGCVYGGKLSGWLMEEDRVLQVPARRVYKPVG